MRHETPQEVLMSVLRAALSKRRPYGGVNEGALLMHIAFGVRSFRPSTTMWVDAAGNLHVDMRAFNSKGKTKHRTLFVAHLDTVHSLDGDNQLDDSTSTWRARAGQPLGADDGAGVAMLAGLIRAGTPGYYIFTRGEERGGVGAKALADDMDDILVQFDRAIAFDRRDTFSVITHQGWRGCCCSDAFADALSTELNVRGMMYMPDDTGVYTDTAEFTELIPECTNLSVGYLNEHTPREELDIEHLKALFEACLTIEWDGLPVVRDPADDDTWDYGGRYAAKMYGPGASTVYPFVTPTKTTVAKGEVVDPDDDEPQLTEAERAEARAFFKQYADGTMSDDEIEAALDRWYEGGLDDIALRTLPDDASDPAFAWSDDGKTFHTGSGSKGH